MDLTAWAPQLRERLLHTIRAAMRAQGRSLSGGQGRGLTLGVDTAVAALADVAADPGHDLSEARSVFRRLGATEFHEGHRIDALRGVLSLGGREMWAYLSGQDLPPPALYALASTLFGLVDTLAGAAAEGYLREQEQHARDWDTTRRRLITLLVQVDPPSVTVLQAAADAARWPLPDTVAVLSVDSTDGGNLARAAGHGTIAAVINDATRMIVPAPSTPGRIAHLTAVLKGRRAALGPAVPLASARESYRLSGRALRVLPFGPGGGLVRCDERLFDLLTGWEPGLMDRYARTVLYALSALRDPELETLYAWLRAQGQVVPTAEALHAHPQTVRYRLRNIRRVAGELLDDPDARLSLQLALQHRFRAGEGRLLGS
ncbi:PucR family transcriptional regulator [Actinoplanes sp. RD1]|uniref:PucR family transcriptional regulator n=1 Tax=Actinoplanes sp. RD1 TaxID=3064538 RepID=UPI00274197C4|nr:helix-turn-helix domain-containing protein [Actinoplanes sp. RD1]